MNIVRETKAGDVCLIEFPLHRPRGHEQEGLRPAVVIAIPPPPTRFQTLVVAPCTTRLGDWVIANPRLYPILPAGTAGLGQDCVLLLDQIRAIDNDRVRRWIRILSQDLWANIYEGLSWLRFPDF